MYDLDVNGSFWSHAYLYLQCVGTIVEIERVMSGGARQVGDEYRVRTFCNALDVRCIRCTKLHAW